MTGPRPDAPEGQLSLPGMPGTARRSPMARTATISDCGLYRYELTRAWGPGPRPVFVMLNPSTADSDVDDPTVRRCTGFARSWGFHGVVIVNLYAYRATDPRALRRVDDPVGPGNDAYIAKWAREAAQEHVPVVAAWGVNADTGRVAHVLTLPGMNRVAALGVTKDGYPRHPLYVPAAAVLNPWKAPAGG